MRQYHKITKTFISKIVPPESGKRRYWDEELKRFGVRVLPSGTMAYIIMYHPASGPPREHTLCRTDVMIPAKARKLAMKELGKVANGEDPAGERKADRSAPTFGELAAEYMDGPCRSKASGDDDILMIRKDLLPAWGNIPAKDITRQMVRDVIRAIANPPDDEKFPGRGAPIRANRTLSCIKRIFNHGIDEEMVEHNPTIRVKKPGKERKRQRVLKDAEIRTVWSLLDQMKRSGFYTEAALKLILITGQRPVEIVSMEWSEIEGNWWTIPKDKTKNSEIENATDHRVPLSPLAISILAELPREGRYVFPLKVGRRFDHEQHKTRRSLSYAVHANREFFDMPRWTPHDLRRTAASRLASMGVSNETIDKILNHVLPGVRGVYNQYGYDAEKRVALDAWGEKIGQILRGRGADVVPMVR